MHAPPKSFLLAVPLVVFGTVVQADDNFCNNSVPPSEHFQMRADHGRTRCGELDLARQVGSSPLSAVSVSTGSGAFASVASASADASPGLLRGFASAEMLGRSVADAYAVARSDAWFASGGTVVGAAGIANGTPVVLTSPRRSAKASRCS